MNTGITLLTTKRKYGRIEITKIIGRRQGI